MTEFKLPDDLFPYQKEDYKKIIEGGNFLNSSEMGTGKTPTSLAVVEEGKFRFPLLVTPNSLRLEWKRQVENWVGDNLVAMTHQDCYRRLEPIFQGFLNGQRYKIVNYEIFRNEESVNLLKEIPFDLIIFDEVHKLRNSKTKQVKGVWNFMNSQKAKVLALSGSPIMNYPIDLYVPLSLIDPKKWHRDVHSHNAFTYHFTYMAQGRFGTYSYESKNISELKQITEPYLIRRTKNEVLPYLPDKMYRRVLLEMGADQRKLYDQMENELSILLDTGEPLWSTNVLAALTRLRQLNLDPKILGVTSSSAKTDFIVDTIESMIDPRANNGKLVIFSCFEKYIHLLSMMYPNNSVEVTGLVSIEERQKRVKKFQEDPNCKIFFGTIQCAGEGITLTAASNIVMADRWWNEPTNQQAIDRLHRIGQKNSVQVILPICEDSVDETLDRILQNKAQAASGYFKDNKVTQMVLEDRTGKVRI